MNVDASVIKEMEKFGWGMMIRDESRKPVIAAHRGGNGLPSVLKAKAKSFL